MKSAQFSARNKNTRRTWREKKQAIRDKFIVTGLSGGLDSRRSLRPRRSHDDGDVLRRAACTAGVESEAREPRGFSISDQVAERSGLDRAMVSRLENGKQVLHRGHAHALCCRRGKAIFLWSFAETPEGDEW